jgi:hypothetical protein
MLNKEERRERFERRRAHQRHCQRGWIAGNPRFADHRNRFERRAEVNEDSLPRRTSQARLLGGGF